MASAHAGAAVAEVPLCRRVCAAHILLHALQTSDADVLPSTTQPTPERLICRSSLAWRQAFFVLAIGPDGLNVVEDTRIHIHDHAETQSAESRTDNHPGDCAACASAPARAGPLPPMHHSFFSHPQPCPRPSHSWSTSSCDCLCACVRNTGGEVPTTLLLLRLLTALTRVDAYDARARTVLRIFTRMMGLPATTLSTVETTLAVGLLAQLQQGHAAPPPSASRMPLYMRVGMIAAAAVTGAVVLTVAGGLAAPAILAAAGALASTLGVSATILASTYTSTVIVALFGLYGGGFVGYRMHARTSGLSVFAFRHLTCASGDQHDGVEAHTDTLHAVVAVSGVLLPAPLGEDDEAMPAPRATAAAAPLARSSTWPRRVWPFNRSQAAPAAASTGIPPGAASAHRDHLRPWGGARQCIPPTSATEPAVVEQPPIRCDDVVNMPTLCVCDAGLLIHPARGDDASAARTCVFALLQESGILFPEDVMLPPGDDAADALERFNRAWPLETFTAAAHVDDGCISLIYALDAEPGSADATAVTHGDVASRVVCGFLGHTAIQREQAGVHSCEVRVVLTTSYTGRGWGTAALRCYTAWLLSSTPATRVYFTLPARAARAYACAERVGYTACGGVTFNGCRFIRLACEALSAPPVHVLDDDEHARLCASLPVTLPVSSSAPPASARSEEKEAAAVTRIKGMLAALPDVSTSVQALTRTGHTFLTVGTGTCVSAPCWMRTHMPSATGVTLIWDPHVGVALGASLTRFIRDYVSSSTISQMVAQTSLAALASAVALPTMAMSAFSLLDTPWGTAHQRADEAGVELAHALMSAGVAGHRPITLLGYGIGARVCWRACLTIARAAAAAAAQTDSLHGDEKVRNPWGIISDVVLMGAPVAADVRAWAAVRSIVSGRLINVFSRSDVVCGYVYRVAHMAWNVAGAGPVTQSGLQTTTHVPGSTIIAPVVKPVLSRVLPATASPAASAEGSTAGERGETPDPTLDDEDSSDVATVAATAARARRAAGDAMIEAEMENVDVSHIVTGHLEYRNHIQEILAYCGLLEVEAADDAAVEGAAH